MRGQANILLVDDRLENLLALEATLSELGQNLITATSGEEALRQVLRHDFAVILLDVSMPAMDGFETASLIRQRERSKLTLIIFVTANESGDERVRQGYQLGAVDYLLKPFSPDILRWKVAVFVDLYLKTLEVQQMEEVKRLNREIEAASAIRMRFLGMNSHELRRPLTSIKGFASTLLEPGITWDAERQREFLEIINLEADTLTNLIEQLLDMTSLEAGTLNIQPDSCDVEAILHEAMPQLITLAHHHRLEITPLPPLPPVYVDKRRTIQVLSNLVSNACRYAPEHTCIQILAASDGRFVEIRVSDEGPGIPANAWKTIFDPFVQANNRPSESKGIGLGLAISKGIVEKQGGSIWVADSSAKGTAIAFTLPVNHR
jgi:two-component system, sensor histidine kinase